MTERRARWPVLRTMAVLFGALALSDCTKAWQHLRDPKVLGIVLFGIRVESFGANLALGWTMGLVLGAYAYALWTRRRWAVPLSIAYAFWVPTNLVLFWYRQTGPDVPPLRFVVGYLIVSLGGSIGTALYLAYHRDELA